MVARNIVQVFPRLCTAVTLKSTSAINLCGSSEWTQMWNVSAIRAQPGENKEGGNM